MQRFSSVIFAIALVFVAGSAGYTGPGVLADMFGGDVVCANAKTGQVPTKQANGTWAPGSAGASYTGTAHQVIVTGSVLSAPQDLDTTSRPTFAGIDHSIGTNQNTLYGYQVGLNLTDGFLNTVSGYQAGLALNHGARNSVFGVNALQGNDVGACSAFGFDALAQDHDGNCEAFGYFALYANYSGQFNAAFGREAGYTETPANANYSGSYNTYLGVQTGANSATQRTNTTTVGYRAHSTADNQVVLGNTDVTSVLTYGALTLPEVDLPYSAGANVIFFGAHDATRPALGVFNSTLELQLGDLSGLAGLRAGTVDTNNLIVDTGAVVYNVLKPGAAGGTTLGQGGVGFDTLYLDYTNTATVGDVTINKPSGTVNLAALASTMTVTDSKVTANSHVMVTLASDPGVTLTVWTVASAGSFTINTRPATTNQLAIHFVVSGAD